MNNFFDSLDLVVIKSENQPVLESMHNELKKDLEIARLHKELHTAKKLLKQVEKREMPESLKQEILSCVGE